MDMTHLIYAFVDGNGKPFYVGKTKNIEQRNSQHLYEVSIGNKLPKYNKLRKLLKEGHEFSKLVSILEEGLTCEQVDEREVYHIKKLREDGYKLRNLTDGGEGNSNPSLELRKRWSKARIGKAISQEVRKKISLSNKGKKLSDEHKFNLKKAWTTRPSATEETRLKRSNSAKGKINIKKYELTDPQGNVHVTENGLTLFCEQHGLSHPNVIKVANGQRPRHKGWTARRLEVDETK